MLAQENNRDQRDGIPTPDPRSDLRMSLLLEDEMRMQFEREGRIKSMEMPGVPSLAWTTLQK